MRNLKLDGVPYIGDAMITFTSDESSKIIAYPAQKNIQIGEGFYIGHFGGITISYATKIGKNFILSQQVTIGISGKGEKRGCPIIGDNVYIAPGAKLFGKIKVGNNVRIGANAVVHEDIPDNATVVLDPGFKILERNRNNANSYIINDL